MKSSTQTLGDLPKQLQKYVARSEDLQSIESRLNQTSRPNILLISGLGGCGKTQLANRYIHKAMERNAYQFIAWFSASDNVMQHAALANLAKHLGQKPAENSERAFQKYLNQLTQEHSKSLLVFDDVNNFVLFEPLFNTSIYPENVHIIITSRQQSRLIDQIHLNVFSETECIQYVKTHFPHASDDDINKLGAQLGYLPLALCQAISYMQMTEESISGYLSLYLEQKKYQQHLLDVSIDGYNQTIWTTWDVSIACVIKSSPLALKILRLCYYLYSEKIPRSLLTTVCKDRIALNEAINLLIRYSIISVSEDGNYLSIHNLVQVIMGMKFQLDIFEPDKNDDTLLTLLETLKDEFHFDFDHGTDQWQTLSILIPNVMSLLQHAISKKIYIYSVYRLLHQLGLFQYYALIQPNQAQKTLLIALTIIKQLERPCALSIAVLESDLSVNSICLPCNHQANKYYQPAMNFFQAHTIDINNSEIARTISNLCYVYLHTENHGNISRYCQPLHDFQLIHFTDKNFQHAMSDYLSNKPKEINTMLGLQLGLYNKLSRHYGATHFLVARQHYNLALLYLQKNDYGPAKHHCGLALELYERCWGNTAIETLYVLRLSSLIDFHMNKIESALQKARQIMLTTAEYHSSNIIAHGFSLFHYGALLCENNDSEQACNYLNQATKAFHQYSKENSTCVCLLINLVEYGYLNALKTVLEKNISLITERDCHGNTGLLAAAFQQRTNMIDLLIENSSSLRERNNFGLTPALWAGYHGNIDFLTHLLTHADKKSTPIILNDTDTVGNNLMALATLNNHFEMLEYLLDELKLTSQVDCTNDFGYSPLFLSIFYGFDKLTIKQLIHSTRKNPTDIFSYSPAQLGRIYRAIYDGEKEAFLQLINPFTGICLCGMTGYQLTEEQFLFVISCLTETTNIKHVIFAHQQFHITTIKALAKFMSQNKTLETIDCRVHYLSDHQLKINNNGAKLLLDVYEKNNSLHQLSLTNHPISNEHMERLQTLNQAKQAKRKAQQKQKSSDYDIYYNGEIVNVPKREAQCLMYLADGLSAKQTASMLFLSQRTVELYLDKLKKRFACRTKLELLSIIPPSEIDNIRSLLF